MFLPVEVISSPQQIPVVQVNDLTMIPSAQQVRQAISNLYKKQEAASDQFSYVKSHLVYWTMTGYRNYRSTTSRNLDESSRVKKEWLKGCESLCSNIGIDIAKIKQFFETQVWDN